MGINEINEKLNSSVNEIYNFTQKYNITKEDVPMMECLSKMAREQGATPAQEISATLYVTAVMKNEQIFNSLLQGCSKKLLYTIGGIINGETKK